MSKYHWVRIHRIRNWKKSGPRAHQELKCYLHIEYQKQYLECFVGNTSSSSAKLCQNKEEPFHLPTRELILKGRNAEGTPVGAIFYVFVGFFLHSAIQIEKKTYSMYPAQAMYVTNIYCAIELKWLDVRPIFVPCNMLWDWDGAFFLFPNNCFTWKWAWNWLLVMVEVQWSKTPDFPLSASSR